MFLLTFKKFSICVNVRSITLFYQLSDLQRQNLFHNIKVCIALSHKYRNSCNSTLLLHLSMSLLHYAHLSDMRQHWTCTQHTLLCLNYCALLYFVDDTTIESRGKDVGSVTVGDQGRGIWCIQLL